MLGLAKAVWPKCQMTGEARRRSGAEYTHGQKADRTARCVDSPSHRLPRTEVGRKGRLEAPCSFLHHHLLCHLWARHPALLHVHSLRPGMQASSQSVELKMIGRSVGGRTGILQVMSLACCTLSHRICKDGLFVNPQPVICESSIVIYE